MARTKQRAALDRNGDSFEYLSPHRGRSTDFTTSMCGITTTTGGVTQGWEVSVERCIATKPVVTEFFVIASPGYRVTTGAPRGR